jgi:2-aminoadipate transaminase
VSPLQRALASARDPSLLSLALGMPDPALFPAKELERAAVRALASGDEVLQYNLPCEKLQAQICKQMAERGVDCSPDSVLLTAGATQALALLVRLLLDPGARVVEEELTYPTYQLAVDPYSPDIVTIPSTVRTGIDVDVLERKLARGHRPAFLYLIPDGHNPLGASLSDEKRRRLAELASKYRMPIIEDDVYGSLRYDGPITRPIKALAPEWVYYIGSFSKVLAPALRVGWLVVPPALISPLSVIKEAADVNTSTFAQWVTAEYLEAESLSAHVRSLRHAYRVRRDTMDDALRSCVQPVGSWEVPTCGVFFWIDLPEDINASELLRSAIEHEHVSFLPAETFSRGRRTNGLRLSFSRCQPHEITEAVSRLGRALSRLLSHARYSR